MVSEKVKVEIEIPKNLYYTVIEKAKEAGFSNLNEFFIFILEQLFESEETSEEVFTPEEEEAVKERLRSLGYIE